MLFAKKWKLSCSLILKVHVGFLVLMVTSVYSFFYDKSVKGKTDVLGLISCGAFAFMSFSLSRQIELGFEVDLLNFFLGCLTVQLMKINLILASVGAVFCYFFIILRSSLDSQPQQQIGMVRITDHVAVQFDAENGLEGASESNRGNNIRCIPGDISHQQKISSLRRRKTAQKLKIKIPDNFFTSTVEDDGHSWRKYAQKENLDCEFPRSYYRCTGKYDQGCQASKQVQRIQENPDMFHIAYIGLHTCKDTLNAPHLVIDSFNRESFMNSHPDYKVPNEQDHSISSSNSSSTIDQEYPRGDTPSDLTNHKLDPSRWSDFNDSEVRAIIAALECDNADTVYSCTSSQNLGVDFGKDEASTHKSSNNEDKGS